jgi:hypothetical protein
MEPRLNATSLSDNLFGESGDIGPGPSRVKFGTPHWVDFGQELEHSPDGKAYIIAHGATSPSSTEMWMLGDQVYMARVAPTVADIDDKSKWEFYAGGHGADAKWVAGDVSTATPLVEWTNHTGSTTMTYFAGDDDDDNRNNDDDGDDNDGYDDDDDSDDDDDDDNDDDDDDDNSNDDGDDDE